MLVNRQGVKYFSNTFKKFYDQVLDVEIGSDPEQVLFTRFMQTDSKQALQKPTVQAIQSIENYKVGRSRYIKFADDNALGSIIQMNHKNVDLTLMSTSFSCQDYSGIYKSIQKIKPDLVLFQIRPDSLLNDFNLIPKNEEVFSNRLYFRQIDRQPFQVMPSRLMRQQVIKRLKGKVTLKDIRHQYLNEYKARLKQSQRFCKYISTQGINNIVIGTSAYYCERNNVRTVLGGLPQISERQILINTHTLMAMQTLFSKSCQQLALYSKVVPRRIADFLFPEVFMNPNDYYMSTLIEYIIALKKHKNILVLTGVMHNQGIREYLLNQKVDSILKCVLPPKPHGSILKKIQNFQVIQKHCILDVMQFGEEIFKTPMESLMTTNRLSDFYADPHHINKLEISRMMTFRLEMYKKYTKIMDQRRQQGQNLKTKEFLRRAIES